VKEEEAINLLCRELSDLSGKFYLEREGEIDDELYEEIQNELDHCEKEVRRKYEDFKPKNPKDE